MDSQNIKVFKYMKKYGGITSYQAFQFLGITRLSARIYDLRQMGVLIGNKHISKKTPGGRIDYDKYFVEEENLCDPTVKEKQSDHSEAREQVVHRPVEAVS